MEKKNTLLKVVSILMVIGGGLGVFIGVFALLTIGTILGAAGAPILVILAVVAGVVGIGGSAINLTAGILGLKYPDRADKQGKLKLFGILSLVISVIGVVLGFSMDSDQSVPSALLGIALPALYLYALSNNRSGDGTYPNRQ